MATGEQAVLSADGHRPDGIFGYLLVNFAIIEGDSEAMKML
jgi:hypothetical protein